jgi:hypothetical protein
MQELHHRMAVVVTVNLLPIVAQQDAVPAVALTAAEGHEELMPT